MFVNPMDTTIHAGMVKGDQAELLKRHVKDTREGRGSQLIAIQEDVHDDFFIYALGTGPYIDPKPFIHPIQFNIGDDTFMVVDARSSTRWDRAQAIPVINNSPLYRRDVILTVLQSVWEGEGPNAIQRLGNIQISIFATWITGSIVRRYGLDPAQQLKLQVISAYYYLCLFSEERKFDPSRAAPLIARSINASTGYVMDVVDTLPFIPDAVEFMRVINESLATERLSGLNLEYFYASLAGSWFGPNNQILVSVAIEYPPIFVSFLYIALTDRSVTRSGIGQIAHKKERDAGAREFIRITSDLLKTEAAE
jgi:hypothetical protein